MKPSIIDQLVLRCDGRMTDLIDAETFLIACINYYAEIVRAQASLISISDQEAIEAARVELHRTFEALPYKLAEGKRVEDSVHLNVHQLYRDAAGPGLVF